jgi:predicted HTH transcriptional regulator
MDEGVDPKNLCQQMVTVIDEHAELESLANPEIRTLFIDWMEELEAEILGYYDKTQEITSDDLVERFKISRQGAEFLIEKMKKENKLK